MQRRHFLHHLGTAVLLCGSAAASLSACSDSKSPAARFHSVDITGADYATGFKLTDFDGKTRTLKDFRDRVVVVFFGYTQCPDVCPMTLGEMARVKQQLGADGDRFQVLFVSLDPARDTPEVLKAYMHSFDTDFLGLYADSDAELDRLAKKFRVFHEKVDGPTPGSYTINHTASSYVYDPKGKLRLFARYGTPVTEIAEDVRLLLQGA